MYYRCSLEDGKKLMIEILKYIDGICVENGLEYYMVAGTLLGAIRHKGFIPWDDDIDIIMTKEDRKKLIDIISNDNNERFGILDRSVDPNYPLELSKVIMKDTICILNEELKSVQAKSEIFVDVFTMDFFEKETSKKYRKYVRLFENARKKVIIDSLQPGAFKSALKVFRVVSKVVVPFDVVKFYKKKNCVENGEYAGFAIEQSSDFICRYEDIYPLKRIQFEDVMVLAPSNPEKILLNQYGETYMQLPPEDKRITHSQYMLVSEDVAKLYKIK